MESDTLRLADAACVVGSRFHLGPVDLALEPGSLTVVRGANGSGKTTLLRVATGLLPLSAGRRECGGTALYLRAGDGGRDGQRVATAVETAAALAGRAAADARGALLETGLAALAGRRVGTLSAGERTRLTVAVAVAVAPALLCLDEPFGPVDTAGARLLTTAVSRLIDGGSAVVVASPQRQPLDDRADACLVVDDGMVSAA